MDFLSGLTKSSDSKPAADEPSHGGAPAKHSSGDLVANAKLLAEAAQAHYNHQPEACDKHKAAIAGAELLDAAEEYGKLDSTKGVGKYAEQAEGYLRQYSGGDKKPEVAPPPAATEKPSEGGEKSEGGSGDLMKTAGGFFK